MKTRILISSLALIAVVAASSQAYAAAYIKFDGVDGESKASAERQHPTVRAIKPVDKASPLLQDTLVSDQGTRALDKSTTKLVEAIATGTANSKPSPSQRSEGRVRVFDGAL